MSATDNPKPDWEGEEKERWLENARDVPRQVKDKEKGMMKRVHTYHTRFDYAIPKVIRKIHRDAMFAACFAKDPKKQVMHENIAADYLRKIALVGDDFEMLPNGGEGAWHINAKGVFRQGKGKRAQDSKTLDFCWTTAGIKCWASHKYTKESGGAQDHQFKDQKRFLENFRKHKGERVAFFAICDGEYYTDKKMDELRQATNDNPPSFAVHIEEVATKLRELR